MLLEEAIRDLEKTGEKINVSRLSAVTGIHRRDVIRIYKDHETVDISTDRISRIIGQWQSDERFTTKQGEARTLTTEGEGAEFRTLLSSVSSELHPSTVLFELQRVGAVELRGNKLRLIKRTYQPVEDPEKGFEFLAHDAGELIAAVEQNIFSCPSVPNLHGRTTFDGIREDKVQKIRKWLYEEGSSFHARARAFLSRFDLDINPDPNFEGKRVKVSLGAFSRISAEGVSHNEPEK